MDGDMFLGISTASPNNFGIRLESANWHTWKFQIKVILKSINAYNLVDGTFLCPTTDLSKIDEWKKLDAKAQGVIVMRLSNGAMLQVQNCETAKEMWDKLCSVYEQKSDVSLHILQQRFFDMKYNKSEDITTFMAKIEDIVSQIRQAKGDIPENMIMTKIISSLGENFRHFVSAWDSVPIEKRTMSELTARLIIEEQRNKIINESKEENYQTAFKTDTKKNLRKCFNCGKVGHYKKDCRKMRTFCKHCNKSGHSYDKCWFKNKPVMNNKQNAFIMSVSALTSKTYQNEWFLDSGASEHMCCNKDSFVNYQSLLTPKDVIIGNGTVIKALGYGEIKCEAFDNEHWLKTTMSNVLFVPDIKVNLFSLSAALDKGYSLISSSDKCEFMKNNIVHAVAKRQGKMYIMMFRESKEVAMIGKIDTELKEWHVKLGHQNIEQIKSILKKNQIEFDKGEEETCIPCLKGKQHKFPFPVIGSRATMPGEIIHVDIGGPIEEQSLGGARFFLLLKDDFSKYKKVYFLKNKNESVRFLKEFFKEAEINPGHKVKYLRSDNAKELVGLEMKNLLKSLGIQHQTSVVYTPEQNGCIEREMRTVVESARTMLLESGLKKNLWAEAINTAVFIINRSGPSRIKDKTPFELWWRKEYDIKNLKMFGNKVAIHVPDQKRLKFDSKAKFGYFVGYGENTKGYRIYIPHTNNVEIQRNVVFIKGKHDYKEIKSKIPTSFNRLEEIEWKEYENEGDQIDEYEQNESEEGSINSFHEENENEMQESVRESTQDCLERESEDNRERPKREIKKPKWLDQYVLEENEGNFLSYCCDEPITYEEAMKRPDRCMWEQAMKKELEVLEENNTWEEVSEIQDGEKMISSKWVFKIKDVNGKSIYKARLVARGFEQENCDNLTYSPVAKMNTFRMFMAVATQKRKFVYQMDVTGAFLYGDINENVFMRLPNNGICKLKKSI